MRFSKMMHLSNELIAMGRKEKELDKMAVALGRTIIEAMPPMEEEAPGGGKIYKYDLNVSRYFEERVKK